MTIKLDAPPRVGMGETPAQTALANALAVNAYVLATFRPNSEGKRVTLRSHMHLRQAWANHAAAGSAHRDILEAKIALIEALVASRTYQQASDIVRSLDAIATADRALEAQGLAYYDRTGIASPVYCI